MLSATLSGEKQKKKREKICMRFLIFVFVGLNAFVLCFLVGGTHPIVRARSVFLWSNDDCSFYK